MQEILQKRSLLKPKPIIKPQFQTLREIQKYLDQQMQKKIVNTDNSISKSDDTPFFGKKPILNSSVAGAFYNTQANQPSNAPWTNFQPDISLQKRLFQNNIEKNKILTMEIAKQRKYEQFLQRFNPENAHFNSQRSFVPYNSG